MSAFLLPAALLAILGLACPPLLAADVTVHCIDPAKVAGNPPLYCFADQAPAFDAEVTAPLGARLSLFADLYQTTAGDLSAILLHAVQVSRILQFDHVTQLTTACALPTLPAVQRPTRLLLKLYIRMEGHPDEAPIPAGTIDLFDSPRRSPADWRKIVAAALAESNFARIAVFGRKATLRHFLHRQGIPYDDLGVAWPATLDPKLLYLGDSPPPDYIPALVGAHAALFVPEDSGSLMLPGIYSVSDKSGGSVEKVTFPGLLAQLEETPRYQDIFLEIIRRALHPSAAAYPLASP